MDPKDKIGAKPETVSSDDGNVPSKTTEGVVNAFGYAIKPFYSKDHRRAITERCIARALSKAVEDTDEQQEINEQKDVTLKEQVRPKQMDAYDWTAPLQLRWKWDSVFLIYTVQLERAAPRLFAKLRKNHFHINSDIYYKLFSTSLQPLSNLGLSGSIFFHTAPMSDNSAGLIIKSINRYFEYEFLHTTLLPAYIEYYESLEEMGDSILSRITDVIWCADSSVGGMLKLSPRHYMVMVDIIGDMKNIEGAEKWDLKPDIFEPTRDLVPDNLKSEATKSGLADALPPEVRIKLTKIQYESLLRVVKRDTDFLRTLGTVDYSLLLGRWPASQGDKITLPLGFEEPNAHPEDVGLLSTSRFKAVLHSLRGPHKRREGTSAVEGEVLSGGDFIRGVVSADGKWIYRLTIVDFLWNVEKLVPTVMRTAGKAVLLPDQTITTEPETYREAFLKMIDDYVDIIEQS